MNLNLKALSATDNGNGTFTIELPDSPSMSHEEAALFERLFPNLENAALDLLAKEALLAALASPAEASAPRFIAKPGKKYTPETPAY